MKYALKVKIDDGDWIYVTEADENNWDNKPILYDSFEQANQAASVFKAESVKVVEFLI